MGYPEYDVGFVGPERFEQARSMFFDAIDTHGYNTPFTIDLAGPTDRLEMLRERMHPDFGGIEEQLRPGESQMWIVGFLNQYHAESQRSTSADSFTLEVMSAHGEPVDICIEASYLRDMSVMAPAEEFDFTAVEERADEPEPTYIS